MLWEWDSILWGLLILLIIFAVLVGKNQMIRIIIGNYILMIISLSFAGAVDMWMRGTQTLLVEWSEWNLAGLLSDGRVTITLVLYALLLFLIFKKSTLHSSHPWLLDKGFLILLIPMTVISMALTISLIFLGTDVFDPAAMTRVANSLSTNLTIRTTITNTPLWLFAHGLLTVLLTTHLSLDYFTRKPIETVDDFLE